MLINNEHFTLYIFTIHDKIFAIETCQPTKVNQNNIKKKKYKTMHIKPNQIIQHFLKGIYKKDSVV